MINLFNRTFDQAKQSVLEYMASLLPDVTDQTLSNPLIKTVYVWLNLSEQLGYYINDAATENFYQTARRYRSLATHAKGKGYRIRLSNPATVDVQFSTSSPAATNIIIPQGTRISTFDSLYQFETTTDGVILAGSSTTTIPAIQFDSGIDDFLTTNADSNAKFMQIALPVKTSDNHISIRVNGELWQKVDSLAKHKSDSKVYTTVILPSGQPAARFGDGVTGLIPIGVISIQVRGTSGFDGNVGARELTVMQDIVQGVSCTNLAAASGGKGLDTLFEVRRGIEGLSRTLGTAVLKEDLKAVAESVNGVLKAGVNVVNGKPIEVFIFPTGGGIASSILKTQVKDVVDSKRVLGREVVIKDAGLVQAIVTVKVNQNLNFSQEAIRQSVVASLAERFSVLNQEIGGSIALGDVYETVESVQGVLSSEVTQMTYIPYARPRNANQLLDWDISVGVEAHGVVKWTILFTTNSVFNLYKNDRFIGIFASNNSVEFEYIKFIIHQNYNAGDAWDFYTYKGFGSINLQEQSIPVLFSDSINVVF